MDDFSFKILKKDPKSKARSGVIHTLHGEIKTPAFVPVGTQATVKSLDNLDLEQIGVQIFFANTYHLYLRPGEKVIREMGGLHKFIGWNRPLITDSAGFQVFSLARKSERIKSKELRIVAGEDLSLPLVKITEEGVLFRSHLDGSEHFFTPEKSIQIQNSLGADIMIAFDECTPYPSPHDYAEKAMERTHRWAERCLIYNSKGKRQKAKLRMQEQALYGVVQGGIYQDLREQSAKFIAGLPFEGVAIGGVAVGESKKEMEDVLSWTVPFLPEEKPRHLLGVGEIDDIFKLVEMGIDTFDCVMPTRLARTGLALAKGKRQKVKIKIKEKFLLDLAKAEFTEDKKPIDEDCDCMVCRNYNRGYIHHLFRAKELLGYRLITYHNLWFMERLVEEIREAIFNNELSELKKHWLK